MPLINELQLSPPKYWQAFEELAADLWEKVFNSTNTNLHGRTGQKQHGVDVFGLIGDSDKWFGVQCKGKDGNYGQYELINGEIIKRPMPKGLKPRKPQHL